MSNTPLSLYLSHRHLNGNSALPPTTNDPTFTVPPARPEFAKLHAFISGGINSGGQGAKSIGKAVLAHVYLALLPNTSENFHNSTSGAEAAELLKTYGTIYLSQYEQNQLSKIVNQDQAETDEYCMNIRRNKFIVQCSQWTYLLLIHFLQEGGEELLPTLKIVNQYIDIQGRQLVKITVRNANSTASSHTRQTDTRRSDGSGQQSTARRDGDPSAA